MLDLTSDQGNANEKTPDGATHPAKWLKSETVTGVGEGGGHPGYVHPALHHDLCTFLSVYIHDFLTLIILIVNNQVDIFRL